MCDPGPVRTALARIPTVQIESARDAARAHARTADTPQLADIFSQVADEYNVEVKDRLLTDLTRAVLEESREQTRQMRNFITQMSS